MSRRTGRGVQLRPSRSRPEDWMAASNPLPAMTTKQPRNTPMTAAAFLTKPVSLATSDLFTQARWRRYWLPSAAVLLTAVAPAAFADPGNPLNDRFNFQLGGFLLSTETTLRADGALRGTEINSERDLGL